MTHKVDVPWLVTEYGAGWSVASLARHLHVDSSVVSRRIAGAGVTLRDAAAATAANLARDPAIRTRMGRPRVLPVNERFFDHLTPDVAYIVGLLQADGSNQRDRGVITITLKRSDAALLAAVAEAMGAPRGLSPNQSGGLIFAVQCRPLSDGLADWGVVSPKTHTASTHPALLDNRHYWRGVIDGDGTLCDTAEGRQILALVGSQPICVEFLAYCARRGAGLRCTVRPHKTIWSVHLSGREARAIAAALYDGAGLALARKQAIAARWERLP